MPSAHIRHVLVCLAVWLPAGALCAAPTQTKADTSAEQVARSLQRKYDAVRDFSADFVHAYEGGVLKKRIAERGRVLIKKPGKMRWEYSAPEPKLFVSDGVTLYSYIPQDHQVFVSAVAPDDRVATPALFLAGKGNLIRDFAPSLVPPPSGLPAGVLALKLVPTSAQPDYDWLILAVDPASLVIRGLVTVDAQGGRSTFSFTNLQENVGVADRHFTFTIPRGVEVVRESGVGR
jgi:outer membrane lipoprotein carrier protein